MMAILDPNRDAFGRQKDGVPNRPVANELVTASGEKIRPATPHVVAWPAYARDSDLDPWDTDSAADQRRHWHTACWGARNRRR